MKWETAQSRQDAVYILSRQNEYLHQKLSTINHEMNYLHQKLSTINHELLGNISVHPRTLSLLSNSDADKKR